MNIVNRLSAILSIIVMGCAPSPSPLDATPAPVVTTVANPTQTQVPTKLPTQVPTPTQEVMSMPDSIVADVLSVDVSGQANAYQFNVQVSSPDTGCDQYADWWEVLSEDGQLLYRRVLLHSHVNEQPFMRSGGPVGVDDDTIVIVRAHMNNGGYGGVALRGSASSGFETVQLESGFAADVKALSPLPDGCAF